MIRLAHYRKPCGRIEPLGETTWDTHHMSWYTRKQVLLPIEFHNNTFKTAFHLGLDLLEVQQQRLLQLNELDEF